VKHDEYQHHPHTSEPSDWATVACLSYSFGELGETRYAKIMPSLFHSTLSPHAPTPNQQPENLQLGTTIPPSRDPTRIPFPPSLFLPRDLTATLGHTTDRRPPGICRLAIACAYTSLLHPCRALALACLPAALSRQVGPCPGHREHPRAGTVFQVVQTRTNVAPCTYMHGIEP
jgi:hypothetical protein